jgi:hypothetical protein
MTKKHLAAARKEQTELVGKEMLLFKCSKGMEYDEIMSMDLPFVIFIPVGRGGQETARRVPPASLQLPRRTAETFYEMVVTLQQSHTENKKYAFPVPISRYDTLSTFGMYNRPESAEKVTDHLVTLGISLPRWSYGPLDHVSVYIKLAPNPDWMSKARKVTIQKITIGIDEDIIYNHEGDEPQRKTKSLARRTENVGVKMPEAGYFTNLGLVFPARDLRDSDGIMPRGKVAFPTYAVSGFTTTAGLYKVEYYLTVKVGEVWFLHGNLLTGTTGSYERRQRHFIETSNSRVSIGSRELQIRNGGHRAGCERCGVRERGESDAPSCYDCTRQ